MYSGEKSVQTATNICGKSVALFILYKKHFKKKLYKEKLNYIFDKFKMSIFHISVSELTNVMWMC